MFMVYGVGGPSFSGSLEELRRVNALARSSAARRVASRATEFEAGTVFEGRSSAAAINAYKALLQTDTDRGPLYHACQIMSREVITLQDDDEVAQAWEVFRQHCIHQSPVLNAENRLVGIVSERDLLTTIDIRDGKVVDAMHKKVRDVMTSPVVAAELVTDIRRIATVMLDYHVDGVPIVNDNQALVGFISRTDILNSVITDPPLSLWR